MKTPLEEILNKFVEYYHEEGIGEYEDYENFMRQAYLAGIDAVEVGDIEPATGHPARFNYPDDYYVGYNKCIDTLEANKKELKEGII